MTVAAILKQKGGEVVSVTPAATLPEIAAIIAARRIGAVIVLQGEGQLAGIVSERDVVKAIAAHGAAALGKTAADIMTANVITATPKTTINDAMAQMDAGYFRHLPVVDNGKLVGIISVKDVVHARIETQALEVDSLTEFVHRGVLAGGLR